MKNFVGKRLTIVGKTHPHCGEEVNGVGIRKYKEESALICQKDNGKKFYVFDEEDIKIK